MRRAPIPHAACGGARVCKSSATAAGARACARLLPQRLALLIVSACRARAQDPSKPASAPPPKAFPRPSPAASSGPAPRSIAPSRSTCRPTSSSTTRKASRVIAQGNVEIYYNNYILTAEQVIYDQSVNKLDRRGQRAAQGPQRQHHARGPLRGARRFPRCLRPVAERGHQGRHAHRRRARQPPRGQHHRVRARQVHAL